MPVGVRGFPDLEGNSDLEGISDLGSRDEVSAHDGESIHDDEASLNNAASLNNEATFEETYDEKVARLRRDCRRLTDLIACELDSSAMEIERFYRKHLGFGQAGATLAQLEHKHDVLRRKAGELRTAVD